MLSARLLALLSVCLPLWSSASAQSEKILVVSGSGVPGKLEEDVTEALDSVGSVMSSAGYTGNLRARKQAPDSEEALTKLAPQMGATLIVVLELSRNKLELAFRNGRTGRVIDEESVPARGKRPKLAPPARRKIASAAKRAMEKVGPGSSSSPAVERSYPQETTSARAPSRPAASTRTLAPSRPAPVEEDAEEAEESSEEPSEDSAAAGEQPHAGADAGIAFLLNVGGGVGSRSNLVPTRSGGTGIETSFAPALDVNAFLHFPLGEKLFARLGGSYRTLFALSTPYFDRAGLPAQSSLSSHSFLGGASVGAYTNGPESLAWQVFLGWAYRGLSAAEPSLPSSSIQGPALRPELLIPIANGVITLRIAPELILVVGASSKVPQNVPGLASVGFAYGGEATFDVRISTVVGLGLQFRESRALISSDWGTSAQENERYITAWLNLKL